MKAASMGIGPGGGDAERKTFDCMALIAGKRLLAEIVSLYERHIKKLEATVMRKKSYNLWPAANGKPGDRVVWASCGWKLTVNLLINGTTGDGDRRSIKRCYDLWYQER